MKVQKKQFSLKTKDWKFKTRSEGRRMKIYIKLNKQESHQWSNIKGAVMGAEGNMSDEDFAKIMLFRGLNGFMDDLNKAMDEMSDEEKAKVLKEAEAGVEGDVELSIPVAEDEDNENSENSGE